MPRDSSWPLSAEPSAPSQVRRPTPAPAGHADWETVPPADRDAKLGERLGALIERAWREVPSLRRRFEGAGLSPETYENVFDLNRIPVVERAWLVAQQHHHPPFGGWLLVPPEQLHAVHCLPGPLRLPEGREPDYWRWGAALAAAGVERGALVIVEHSARHLMGPMVLSGIAARDGVAVPVNPLDAEALESFGPWAAEAAYVGTARGLEILLARITPGVLRTAILTAGPLSRSLAMRAHRLHLEIFRGFGTPELGCLGFECSPGSGLHPVADAIVEVIDPTSGQPPPDGELGKVVGSRLDDVYPLLRFTTSARAAWSYEECLCGRQTPRLVKFTES